MEIYHGESGESLHLQFVYVYINIVMYLANIGLAIGDYICNPSIVVKNSLPFTFLQKVTNTEAGVVYLLTSICFFIYGGRYEWIFLVFCLLNFFVFVWNFLLPSFDYLLIILIFIDFERFYLRFSPWGENIGTGPLLFKMKHNILPRVKVWNPHQ